MKSADKAKFAIDETGALSFAEAPDFETPGSAASSNAYSVVVVATDAAGNESSQTVTVDVTDFDETNPVITGPSGNPGDETSTASIVENTTAVHSFTTDRIVTWSLGESADKDKFAIDETGALSFAEAPDFETPASSASSNAYSVVVVATDAAGNESSQTVTVDN